MPFSKTQGGNTISNKIFHYQKAKICMIAHRQEKLLVFFCQYIVKVDFQQLIKPLKWQLITWN